MFPFLDDQGCVRCNRCMSATAAQRPGLPARAAAASTHPAGSAITAEDRHHGHRQVNGGWLRASVFGAMDGLVTNTSLIAGVGGGGASHNILVVGGLAGLIAGSFSMAAGEWTSVHTPNA